MTPHSPRNAHPSPLLHVPPPRPTVLQRIGTGRILLGAGVLTVAVLQVLTTGDQPAPRTPPTSPLAHAEAIPARASGPAIVPASISRPAAGATAAAPKAKAKAAPAKAGDAAPAEPKIERRRADATKLRTYDPIVREDFDCKPVRTDKSASTTELAVPLPPFSKDVFPCTRCHDRPDDFNATKRNLTLDHTNIKLVHGPREQWCYGCHNPTDRDTLRLAGGRKVSFKKSYELCGQCHGPKLREWRAGIHGRRRGCWNGQREYLLCVHCHSPHAPRFRAIKPKPRPRKPTEIQARSQPKGGN